MCLDTGGNHIFSNLLYLQIFATSDGFRFEFKTEAADGAESQTKIVEVANLGAKGHLTDYALLREIVLENNVPASNR